MIYTEVDRLKIMDTFEPVQLSLYTGSASVTVTAVPDWLNIGYSVGDVITATNNKILLSVSALANEYSFIEGTLKFEDVDNTLAIPVLFLYDAGTVTTDEIVDNIMLSGIPGSYLEGIDRMTVTGLVRRAIQHLNLLSAGFIARAQLILDSTDRLRCPQDMVTPIRLFGISDDGQLHELYEYKKLNAGALNLISNQNIVLQNPEALEGEGIGASPIEFDSESLEGEIPPGVFNSHGHYRYNPQDRTYFIWGSPYEEFLLEYNADPIAREQLGTGEMRISKYWSEPVENWVYFKWVERRKDVPRSEIYRANQQFGLSERIAKRAQVNYAALIQSLKGKL